MYEFVYTEKSYYGKIDNAVLEKVYVFEPEIHASYEFIWHGCKYLNVEIYDLCTDNVIIGDYQTRDGTTRIANTFIGERRYLITISNKGRITTPIYYRFKFHRIDLPDNTLIRYQWGIINTNTGIDINILPVWQYVRKSDVRVGVLDTGIKNSHPNLIENVNKDLEYNFVHDIKPTYTMTDNESYNLFNAHGTHIAGIIASQPRDRIGTIGVLECDLVSLKILELVSEKSDNFRKASEAFMEAINYALQNDIKILNCSFGGIEYIEKEKELIQQSKDILFVIAAGNDKLNLDYEKRYPACYDLDNVIVVGAVNQNGNLYENSNYGKIVDIVAPGEDIVSTYANDKYIKANGTSCAAAFVTGICCLLLENNKKLKPYQIKKIVTDSRNVTKIKALKDKVKSGGMINAYRSFLASEKF